MKWIDKAKLKQQLLSLFKSKLLLIINIGWTLLIILYSYIGGFQIFIPLFAMIIGGLITFYTQSYFANVKFRRELMVTSLDRKLDTHQKAFAIWSSIVRFVHKPGLLEPMIEQAEDWWRNNCLFLMPESRAAFHQFLLFAASHHDLAHVRNPDIDYRVEIKESWAIIMEPGKTLQEELLLLNLETPNLEGGGESAT